MITTVYFDNGFDTAIVYGLHQWDRDITLEIKGVNINGNAWVQFSMDESGGTAIPVYTKAENGVITAEIPGFVFEKETTKNYVAYAFVYETNIDYGKTIKTIKLNIKARPKPDDYVYTEPEKKRYELLEERIKEIEENGVSGGNVMVDDSLSETSENPVQNKVVDKAFKDLGKRIPTKTSQLDNDEGFLTKHQDLSGYAEKATTLEGYGITDGATKEEVKQLSEEIVETNTDITTFSMNGKTVIKPTFSIGSISETGSIVDTSDNRKMYCNEIFETSKVDEIVIHDRNGGTLTICYFDADKNIKGRIAVTSTYKPALYYPYFTFLGYLGSGLNEDEFNSWFTLYSKNMFTEEYDKIADASICEVGSISSSGAFETSTKYMRTKSIILFKKGDWVKPEKGYMCFLQIYDDYGTPNGQSDWIYDRYVFEENTYCRVIMSNVSKRVITDETLIPNNISISIADTSQKYPHYFDCHINSKIQKVNENKLKIVNGVSFNFITDTHWEQNKKHSPYIIEDIAKKTGIGMLVHGGDYLAGQETADKFLTLLSEVVNKYGDVASVYLPIYGNHEWNEHGGESISKVYTYNSVLGNIKQKNGYHFVDARLSAYSGAYADYYYDNQNDKVRYIILNTSTDGQVNKRHLAWLKDTIMGTPDGYTIVVLCHIIWRNDTTTISTDAQILFDLFDAVNAKTTYVSTINDKTVSCDFSSKDLIVSCIMCGHIHTDVSTTTTAGIPVIGTTCDSYYISDKETNNTVGSHEEQAFDIVQIDTDNRKIYTTRIGYGADREFSY